MKKSILVTFLILTCALLLKSKDYDKKNLQVAKVKKFNKKARSIASVPSLILKESKIKKVNKKIRIKKESRDIIEKARLSLSLSLGKSYDVSLTQRSGHRTLKKNETHVLVKLKAPTGASSSYDAIIDSRTGRIKRAWNQTNFEGKMDLKFKAQPYYSN